MSNINRRSFIRLLGAGTAAGVLGAPGVSQARGGNRVVVVGGGFGGATAAKYLKHYDKSLDVTLVERDQVFHTCPFSNMVLGGLYKMDHITHGYEALQKKHGVSVVHDTVTAIDPAGKKLALKGGKTLAYDKLVVSPGIGLKWDAIEGYDKAAAEKIPHAWKAGAQTVTLRKQLEGMADGGVVIIAPPGNPFRCPPGPYERASMIAHYLKHNKPKSKVLILDAKDKFSKQPLFMQGWEKVYPGMIEWVAGDKGGRIDRVDVNRMAVYGELSGEHKGAVINVIPPQKAGAIAHAAGLVNADGWCPVDQRTFESSVHKDVYVIGDASIAGKMPKSGFAASSQAKVCAAAIVSAFAGEAMPEPSYVNTCYSLVAPDYGISVAAVYRLTDKGISGVEGAGGVSPKDADAAFRKAEAEYTRGWYASITRDIWDS